VLVRPLCRIIDKNEKLKMKNEKYKEKIKVVVTDVNARVIFDDSRLINESVAKVKYDCSPPHGQYKICLNRESSRLIDR
jgi:hypothetical protein